MNRKSRIQFKIYMNELNESKKHNISVDPEVGSTYMHINIKFHIYKQCNQMSISNMNITKSLIAKDYEIQMNSVMVINDIIA